MKLTIIYNLYNYNLDVITRIFCVDHFSWMLKEYIFLIYMFLIALIYTTYLYLFLIQNIDPYFHHRIF